VTAQLLQAWCPSCAQMAMPDDRGRCVWCDTAIAVARPPDPAHVVAPARGVFPMLTDELLEESRRMYYEDVQSLRAVARALHPGSGYSSVRSLHEGLRVQFRAQGWPIRGRIDETVRVSTRHGLSRRGAKDPEHRRRLRLASGEVRGVTCAGMRVGYPRKGDPCRRAALAGGDYCAAHEPSLDAERRGRLELAREGLAS